MRGGRDIGPKAASVSVGALEMKFNCLGMNAFTYIPKVRASQFGLNVYWKFATAS